MNDIQKIMLRLMILFRKKLGYPIPQLNEARPIATHWWSIYRHHGRLVRLVPMSGEERKYAEQRQEELETQYLKTKCDRLDQWIEAEIKNNRHSPTPEEREKWLVTYDMENERPEYRPCERCTFSLDTPGSVLPCPYYNVVANSHLHACCTHKYIIIKDVEKT